MSTRYRDPCRGADRATALENLAHRLDRDLVDRHAEDRQSHDRLATHRIDVGDRIGRRDPSELIRVVDHRHEEVHGGNDAGTVIELPYRCIVTGLDTDKELAI